MKRIAALTLLIFTFLPGCTTGIKGFVDKPVMAEKIWFPAEVVRISKEYANINTNITEPQLAAGIATTSSLNTAARLKRRRRAMSSRASYTRIGKASPTDTRSRSTARARPSTRRSPCSASDDGPDLAHRGRRAGRARCRHAHGGQLAAQLGLCRDLHLRQRLPHPGRWLVAPTLMFRRPSNRTSESGVSRVAEASLMAQASTRAVAPGCDGACKSRRFLGSALN